jgi:two-component system cell cycle sensor histidine kinase/response regulator CckA
MRMMFQNLPAKISDRQSFDESLFKMERIVLVDDDSSIRRTTQQILETLGYQVDAYSNGPEALRAITRDSQPISLLLTDYDMPGLTGYELAQLVRAERPGIPVLICSGWPEESLMAAVNPDSRPPFLQKPYTLKSLARKIREILDASAPEALSSFAVSGQVCPAF